MTHQIHQTFVDISLARSLISTNHDLAGANLDLSVEADEMSNETGKKFGAARSQR